MLGKVLEELFIRIWVVIKLTLYFWIYTFVGGIIFGLGTAWKTVNELFYLHGFEYKEITLKRGWKMCIRDSFTTIVHPGITDDGRVRSVVRFVHVHRLSLASSCFWWRRRTDSNDALFEYRCIGFSLYECDTRVFSREPRDDALCAVADR